MEIKGPSTLCLARIEGPVKSPLTTTENHCGQPEEASGDLGLTGPFFMLRRIGNVTQICQSVKSTVVVYAYTKKVVWLLSPVTSAPAGRKHGRVESITLSVAVGPRIPSVGKQEGAICRYILHYRRNKAHHSSGGLQRCGLQEMFFYTAYMEVPLGKTSNPSVVASHL
jgi:hypothetical protein